MYTSTNFKTKKALKDAVAAGHKVTLYAPGIGEPKRDGQETVEGPHYPEPHRWYAQVEMRDGYVVKVKVTDRKVVATSYERYNGGVRAKRAYGSSTITRFFVHYEGDDRDPAKWEKIEGYGPTPGERKTFAIREFRRRREAGVSVQSEVVRR